MRVADVVSGALSDKGGRAGWAKVQPEADSVRRANRVRSSRNLNESDPCRSAARVSGGPSRAGVVLAIVVVWVGLAATAHVATAGPIIDVGTHYLQADTPGQTIEIYVTGDGPEVQGLNFYVQIADGGLEAGGIIDGPVLEDVDIIGEGTMFYDRNTGQTDSLSLPQISVQTTLIDSGTVVALGVLARLTVDTTGFFEGEVFDLKLADTRNGDTDFAGIPIEIVNGLIVIPEPGMIMLMAAGLAAAGLRRRRSRRTGGVSTDR